MKTLSALLMTFGALVSVSLAVPYTSLSGVNRFTKLTDGTVSDEYGALNSSGEYTVYSTRNWTIQELVDGGFAESVLNAINGKFIMDAPFLDNDLVTAEGRERLSNFTIDTSTKYKIWTPYTVYVISAGGTTPKLPIVNITTPKSTIREGGLPSYIVVKLNRSMSDEMLVRYTLGGTAKFKTDYTGPKAVRYAIVPKGKTSIRIPIRPVDDLDNESMESIVFKLAKSDGYRQGINRSVTIQLKDNE